MRQVGVATWNSDHVTVHGSDLLQGASFYCTGQGTDHSLCLHACELLARGVAAGLCAATVKVALSHGVELDDLTIEAAISLQEEASELKLSGIELSISGISVGLTESQFKKLVDEAREKCPTQSWLPAGTKVTTSLRSLATKE